MPTLTGCTPYLEVFDMAASVAFYRDVLGFTVKFATPQVQTAEGRFSHFVRLGRGKVDLMLNTAYDSDERPPERSEARWQGCGNTALYIDADDVPALFTEMTARGLKAKPPAETGYGYLASKPAIQTATASSSTNLSQAPRKRSPGPGEPLQQAGDVFDY